MDSSSSARNPIELLAEEFAQRCRRGESPSVSEYAQRHPELAEQIRDMFPALVLMEQLKPGAADVTGSCAVPPGVEGKQLQRLGDFRILREVGRGGMGIVYEAEQESLGRHVALKVLPSHALLDPKQLQRFKREARAAAKLHHTNIVPVYGVGEQDGLHYYVMQFIQGQGLDQVLDELRRLRGLRGEPAKAPSAPDTPATTRTGPAPASAVAQALLSGRAARGPDSPAGERPPDPPPELVAVRAAPPARPGAAGPPDTSSIHLPGQPEHASLSESNREYFHSVARIGMQVAEALAHANSQGVVHRDIKPSNLLLDTQGVVWVTDFGLAKASDSDGLTHTGDIIGTLRYMAPERFRGRADARSDLYSLGLTLYELLTFRPAFGGSDPNQLIEQIVHDEPRRPSKVNPAVPRDLETVVLKATAREPAHRYQTAQEMADDLKRFVEDKPVRARRAGAAEKLWRWCRRNPALAGLTAAVQLALVGLVALGAWSHARISQALEENDAERREALASRARAVAAGAQAEEARGEAVRARDAAVADAYRALLSETRSLRLAHPSGWRAEALGRLRRLAGMATPLRDLAELRGEAVACCGDFDAFEVMRLEGHSAPVWSLDFSPDGGTLATADYHGSLRLWDTGEGRFLRKYTDKDTDTKQMYQGHAPLPAVRFHPSGDYLAFSTWGRRLGALRLGEGKGPVPAVRGPGGPRYLAFDRKGGMLAATWSPGRVTVHDARTGELKRDIDLAWNRWYCPVALSPEGDLLAAAGPNDAVQVFPLVGGKGPVTLGRHRATVRALAFSPGGDVLASASEDHTVRLWHVSGTHEPATLLGHSARVNAVAFSPDGELVASASDDQTVRLWEARTGRPLMVLYPESGPLLAVAFSPDGTRLAAGYLKVSVYQLTSRQERRRLAGHTYTVHAVAFHPRKAVLASGGSDRQLITWDLRTGRALTRGQVQRNNPVSCVAYSPAGLLAVGVSKFTSGSPSEYSVELWEADGARPGRRLGGPRAAVTSLAFDPAGKFLAAGADDGGAFVWDVAGGAAVQKWQGNKGPVAGLAFLSHGSRLVVAEHAGRVSVRAPVGGEVLRTATVPGRVNSLAVLPGMTQLVLGGGDGALRVLTLPDLEPVATVPKAHARAVVALDVSPDGRMLASAGEDRKVTLWDARTRQKLFTLPQNSPVLGLAFDPDGLRLAVCGVEELITVWNLALVRPQLAVLGLDWGAAPGQPGEKPANPSGLQPAPPVRLVRSPAGAAPAPPDPLDALAMQGQHRSTVRLAEKALRANPKNKQVYSQLAAAQYALADYPASAASAQRHLDLCPDCQWALSHIARSRLASGEPEEAVKALERSLAVSPNQAYACNLLAWVRANGPEGLRDPEKALALAQRAVALAPRALAYQITLGSAYFRLGEFERAVETLRPAIKAPGQNGQALALLLLAMARQKQGDPAGARDAYGQAPRWWQDARPEPVEVQKHQAVRAEAARLLGLKETGDPADRDERLARGRAYARLGRWEQAAADLGAVAAEQSDDARVQLESGRAWAQLGRWDETAAAFARALELLPEEPDQTHPRAQACYELTRWPEALAKALALRPNDTQLLLGRARSHVRHGRWREAEPDYARATATRAPALAAFEYACLKRVLQDAEGAASLTSRYIQRAGEAKDPYVAFVLARTCGLAPAAGVDPGRVVAWGERAVAADASKAYYWHALALARYRAGQFKQALQDLETSDTKGWGQADVLNDLVRVMAYHRLGQADKARRTLAEANRRIYVLAQSPAGEVVLPAPDWLEIQVLRREAEALVRAARPKPRP